MRFCAHSRSARSPACSAASLLLPATILAGRRAWDWLWPDPVRAGRILRATRIMIALGAAASFILVCGLAFDVPAPMPRFYLVAVAMPVAAWLILWAALRTLQAG